MKRSGLVLLVVSIATASTAKEIPIVDGSANGSPVSITGRVSFPDDPTAKSGVKGQLLATNRSAKNILMIRADAYIRDPANVNLHEIWDYDFFFSPDLLAPGSSDLLKLPRWTGRSTAVIRPERPRTYAAIARILFVQFVDGSTWGPSENATNILRDRQRALKKLESLQEAYFRNGSEVFAAHLMQPDTLEPIQELQYLYREKQDAQAVARTLSDMLKNADLHLKGTIHAQ